MLLSSLIHKKLIRKIFLQFFKSIYSVPYLIVLDFTVVDLTLNKLIFDINEFFRSIFSHTAILKLLGRIFDHFSQKLTFRSTVDFSGQSLTFRVKLSADHESCKTSSLSPEKAVWTFKISFLSLKISKLRSQHFLIFNSYIELQYR